MNRYPAETWAEARRMVVQDGASYADASRATGISTSAIQKRAAAQQWQSQRASTMSYQAQAKALKRHLLTRVMEAVDKGEDASQLIFAWQKVEQAWPDHRYDSGESDPKVRRAFLAAFIEELVGYLQAEDRNLLAALQPHLRPFAERVEKRLAA